MTSKMYTTYEEELMHDDIYDYLEGFTLQHLVRLASELSHALVYNTKVDEDFIANFNDAVPYEIACMRILLPHGTSSSLRTYTIIKDGTFRTEFLPEQQSEGYFTAPVAKSNQTHMPVHDTLAWQIIRPIINCSGLLIVNGSSSSVVPEVDLEDWLDEFTGCLGKRLAHTVKESMEERLDAETEMFRKLSAAKNGQLSPASSIDPDSVLHALSFQRSNTAETELTIEPF